MVHDLAKPRASSSRRSSCSWALLTALGVGLFLSAINVRYRDVPYAIPFLIQIWLYFSGVVYAISALPEKWQWVLALNPMTAVISGFQWGVVSTAPPEARQDAGQRRGDGRHVRRRALVLPPLRAQVRGHDLMASAVSVESLSKLYRIGELQSAYGTLRDSMAAAGRRVVHRDHRPHYEEIWAVKDVSFELGEGEVLGIIGRNGAGKSTLLRILTRITTPTAGRATIRGRVGSLLEVGTGFHPELTGRENMFLNGSVLGMKRRDIARKFPDIVEFAGVEKFIDTPVKRYSSGMYVRLAFAVAAHLEPEILLVDEVLAVGDAEFQRRCLGRMEDLELARDARSSSSRIRCRPSRNSASGRSGWTRARTSSTARAPRSSRGISSRASAAGRAATWPDLETAPGDDLVRLRSVRVVQDEEEAAAVDVRRPIGIEIGFTVLRRGDPPVFPKIKVVDQRGRRRLQRHGHEPALAGAGRTG